MRRSRALCVFAGVGALLALLVAGCPNSPSGDLGSLFNQGQNAGADSNGADTSGDSSGADSTGDTTDKSAGVYEALKQSVESDPIDDTSQDESDEQPYFGEANALYEQVGADAAGVSLDSVAQEATESSGAAAVEDSTSDSDQDGTADADDDDSPGDSDADGTTSSDGSGGSGDDSGPPAVPPARHGTFAGRYETEEGASGVIRGRIFDENGDVLAYFRGHGETVPTDQLPDGIVSGGFFRAKIIDPNGKFFGFMHGRFGASEGGDSLLIGLLRDRFHRLHAVAKGTWQDDEDHQGGTLAGRWAQFDLCTEIASLPDYPFADGDFGGLDSTSNPVDDASSAANGNAIENHRSIDQETAEAEPVDDWKLRDDSLERRDGTLPNCVDPTLPFGFMAGWHVKPFDAEDDDETSEFPAGNSFFRGHWRSAFHRVHGFLHGYGVRVGDEAAGGGGGAGKDPATQKVRVNKQPTPKRAPVPKAPKGMRSEIDQGVVLGVFYGRIYSAERVLIGYVRGAYGRSAHGMPVYRGEYFDTSGASKGTLGGRWGNHPRFKGGPFYGMWNGEDLFPDQPDGIPDDSNGDGSVDDDSDDDNSLGGDVADDGTSAGDSDSDGSAGSDDSGGDGTSGV